jgi:D-alanyl-D-alanine carboxypeptidase
MASLTKVMTLYVLFQDLKAGRVKLTTDLVVSRRAASMQPSKLGLKPGSAISVENAIKALVTKSANDVAAAIGENLEGNESNFAARMTRTARAIGMKNTTFKNASGLPNPAQVTTARDMATLSLRIQRDFPNTTPISASLPSPTRGRPFAPTTVVELREPMA